MKLWNLLPILSAPMPLQMALDEILFSEIASSPPSAAPRNDVIASEAKQSPIWRIYFSSEPWISVGYSEKIESLRNDGKAPVCRRITGGGIVHHGRDLIFSIAARKTDDESFKSVRLAYLKIHEGVKAAFEALSLKARFYRCDENLPRGKECFLFPIATDLGVGEKKIAGGAQKRSSGALLHQESIQGIAGLDLFDLATALRESFEKIFEMKLRPMDLDPGLLEKAKELAETKYVISRTREARTRNPVFEKTRFLTPCGGSK